MKELRLFIALLAVVAALSCNKIKEETSETENAAVKLTLSASGTTAFDWTAVSEVMVNNKTCKVRMENGKAVALVSEQASSGSYTVILPAKGYAKSAKTLVMPPAQFPSSGSNPSAAAMPMTGKATVQGTEGSVQVKPLAALLKVPLKNAGAVRSVHVRSIDGTCLSGTFKLNGNALEADASAPCLDWSVLNAAGSGNGSSQTAFYVALPAGTYNQGFEIRVCNTARKACTVTMPSATLTAGEVTTAPELDFSTSSDILFAEYFDNCVWGGDPVGGKMGYGPESGKDRAAVTGDKGTEPAWYPKNAATPGTAFFQTLNWSKREWALNKELAGNLGLGDWNSIFYFCGYQGYVGGDPSKGYQDRPYIILPTTLDIPRPKTVDLSFRICGEAGLQSDLWVYDSTAELLSAEFDGQPYDVDVKTSPNITMMDGESELYYKKMFIAASRLSDGKWHTVKMRLGGFGAWCSMYILSKETRGVKNIFYVDDVVIREVDNQANAYVNTAVTLFPSDIKGQAGADVGNLRLTPSYCTSCNNAYIYSICPVNGMVYMCGGLPHDEDLWAEWVQKGVQLMAQYGNKGKLWCSHMPYGYRSEERGRDLCVPDQTLHDKTVAFYTRAINAIAPLHPVNVLVHCNQTLQFTDGSSADWMVKSLVEIVKASDAIGAHLVVENMSYGVGAKASVLKDCVDRANAQANPKYEIRICMDTGHANLYLNTVGNEGTIVDWLKTAGDRVGHLHIDANRGRKNEIISSTHINAYDDHLFPGYEGYASDSYSLYYDQIGRNNLWGQFYYHLLSTCRYRGPFNYELSSHDIEAMGETRSDHRCTPWSVFYNYDSYVYPAYRSYMGK